MAKPMVDIPLRQTHTSREKFPHLENNVPLLSSANFMRIVADDGGGTNDVKMAGESLSKRLIQVFYPTKTSVLMIRSRKKEIGVLEHSMTLIHGEEVSSREMKAARLALLSQGVCEPTVDVILLPIICLMMNIMV